jgi:hypothetical protein
VNSRDFRRGANAVEGKVERGRGSMADNSFRSLRRDAAARGAGSAQRNTTSDPLAELARLIGQSDAHRGFGRDTGRQAESHDDSAPGAVDWGAAEEDYAEQSRADDYAPRRSGSYYSQSADDAARLHDSAYEDRAYEDEEEAGEGQYAHMPAEDPRSARRNASPQDSYYRDEQQPRNSRAEPLPYIPPAQGSYLADAEEAGEYDYDQNDVEAPPARRSGTIVIVAVLGLAVLGTAGALGYRAMFGGSVIPSLPPIIKPGDTPIKIVPQHDAQAGATNGADTDAKDTTDQVVTHEEQPVNIQSANPVPRVVTTIPVISNAPDAPLPDTQPSAASGPAPDAFPPPPPNSGEANNSALPSGGPPPDQLTGPAGAPPEARPVHTVSILPQQSPAMAQAAPPSEAVPPARVRQPAVRQSWQQPAERTASAGPLSIVPTQDGATVPTRPRTPAAGAGPMALNSSTGTLAAGAPERSGGYAVQVTSQRSEAEAQEAFRSLQAKYPQQLGDRHAFVRRADLGAKGVYYRALIGPFASGQDAVSLCSSLKAAGGSCLIQRN